MAGIEAVAVLVGTGSGKHQGNGLAGGKVAKIEGGEGIRRYVANALGLVGPGDISSGFDGQIGRDETGGGEKDRDFLALFLFFYDSGVRGRSRSGRIKFAYAGGAGVAIWFGVFFGQEEIIDGAVDDGPDDSINDDPLPNGALGIANDL